jgi:hypothetical protein
MNFNHLLSISIPVGILLSGCMTQKGTPPVLSVPSGSAITNDGKEILANAAGTNHTQPFQNYVKHNPHSGLNRSDSKRNTAIKFAKIYAELFVPYHDRQYYIRYKITDKDNWPGVWHWKDSGNNESSNSTLFTTTFDHSKDIDVQPDGKEVTITGTGINGKCHKWKSDATDYTSKPLDSDCKWKAVTCH